MNNKRYAILVCLFSFTLSIPTLVFYVWGYLIGDVQDNLILKRQNENPHALYLSGIRGDVFSYKFALCNQINPTVVAVGSSRSMQVRANFLTSNFVNLGGAVNSIAQLDTVATSLIKLKHKPKIALIFIDFWWFNEGIEAQNPHNVYTPPHELDYLTWSNIGLLKEPISKNGLVIFKDNRLGFGAVYQNQGYDRAGSFHYVSIVTGDRPSIDFRFKRTLDQASLGLGAFLYADNYSPSGVLRFNQIIDRLHRSNIQTLIVLPPWPNPVYKRLRTTNKLLYVDKLATELNKSNTLFDFTNPNNIQGANDCEFIDGVHGGEIIYARMMLQMAQQDKYLHSVSNIEYLSDLIHRHNGMASSETISLYSNGRPETDFLGLGCRK